MSLLLFDIPDQTSVIKLYGEDVQHVVGMEECAELIQAISKNYRAQNLPNTCAVRDKARLNLIEEAADVLVCLQQLMSMWLYSGYVYEQIKDAELLQYVDVLVDGPFVEKLKDPSLAFRGSSNQRILNVPESLKAGEAVLEDS